MRKLTSLLSILILSSCSYAFDRTYQSVTIETPGALNAMCLTYPDGVTHKFYPPQTLNLQNTRKDLVIDCYAPGNRYRQVVVEAVTADHAHYNILNGGAGYVVDGVTNALYKYPDTIYVDFTNMPVKPGALPAQNNPDLPHPDSYDLEEFRPKQPRLREDRYQTSSPIKERQAAKPIFAPQQSTAPVEVTIEK